jgi:hypothetical protein
MMPAEPHRQAPARASPAREPGIFASFSYTLIASLHAD